MRILSLLGPAAGTLALATAAPAAAGAGRLAAADGQGSP